MTVQTLDHRVRYLQIAFNHDLWVVRQTLPKIKMAPNIFIEAGTPFIKQEGMNGIREIRRMWSGHIVADIKTLDGAAQEVAMVRRAGATAATVLGSAPAETLNLFLKTCDELNMISMIDLLGVDDPLDVLRRLEDPPDVVVIHLGRDEESTRGKMIQYRQVKRIHAKYFSLISAAGGVDLKEARSAIFNGANIVVVNIVRPGEAWRGITTEDDIGSITQEFLATIA